MITKLLNNVNTLTTFEVSFGVNDMRGLDRRSCGLSHAVPKKVHPSR